MGRTIKKESLIFLITGILFLLSSNVSSLHAQVKPGDIIDASNWKKAAELLPNSVVEMIKTHGMVIKVGAPREYPLAPSFMEAKKKNAGAAQLENNLADYQAGLPFPDINPQEPKAGLKIAWNTQYHCEPEQRFFPKFTFIWNNKSGTTERTASGNDWKLLYLGGSSNPAVPVLSNPEGLVSKELLQFYNPKDVSGVGFLSLRYTSEKKDDDTWAYVPALRRVRRMSGAQRTDAYIGSDIPIEDFYGFSGKITDFSWKSLGKKKMLMSRDSAGQPCPSSRASFAMYPADYVEWQLRDMWVVESVPKAHHHPYSKRVIYIDDQWHDIAYSEVFDRSGQFWKLFFLTWYWRQEYSSFTISDNFAVDFQAMHATDVPIVCNPLPKENFCPDIFTLSQLERMGH